ncbi:WD40-like Beta Propeller Repeat [Reichenbachiella agariperforans]|uniref:WD40-like Beta Propeller Repeat n=1 Tax=Reichenbachiella agariperforans TaxID=156994 RepID=A0A1M6J1M1_REIAG|nr:OmpA family protein [Reichenbachiella agariperforans]SHJ40542.1 WD40-like Beta Propeller Repeat [Reichenbachiella agariperforans]
MKHIFWILLLASQVTFAQSISEKKLSKKKLIEQADYYFFQEDFVKALELYSDILDNYPRNHYVQYHKYVAYQLTAGTSENLDSLKEYEANEGKTDKFYNYWLGRIHYNRYEFDIAEKHFQAFLDLDIYKTKEITVETKQRLKETVKAQEFYLSPNEFEVVNLGSPINSAYDDLSPAFFSGHSELMFISSRDYAHEGTDYKKPTTHSVFHCVKTGESWDTPTSIDALGTFTEKNAKIEVVNNDGRLFLYKTEAGKSQLYFSQPIKNSWSKPIIFDSRLGSANIQSHFFINDAETVIYFSSKTDNGDLDLYQSIYDPARQSWSSPVAVPGLVNSQYDEDSPFLSHDGKTLYFSSNNPESIGGHDIFMSTWNEGSYGWGTPVNLGFPINTINDEINFQMNEDDISGFMSSDRLHGKGGFDIYYFHKQGKVLVEGTVFNNADGSPVANARIDLKPINNDDETFRTHTDQNGHYETEIFTNENFKGLIYVGNQLAHTETFKSEHPEHSKSFEQNFRIDIPEHVEETDFKTLYDKKSEQKYERMEMLGSKFRAGEKAMLRNIYFDVHSAQLTQESYPVLKELYLMLNKNKSLNVEIGGHTDNTGTLQSNMDLSLARAESVKAYLVKQGIATNRLITKGYGPTEPLASNDDEVNGRELNRRIEVRVLN